MKALRLLSVATVLSAAAMPAHADPMNPSISLILDGYYKSGTTALSERESGFGLGHTELTLSAPVDDLFFGQLTAVLDNHHGHTEIEIEEAFIQTLRLPYGLSLKAGRFLSQVGYLNSRHMHDDDFVERPAAYRAMLGSHYFDDGVQLNLVLPTAFYWQLGVELFNGSQLAGGHGDEDIGVFTLNTRLGGDLGESHSWQLGLSYLHKDGHDDDHDHDHDHDHVHAAQYTGEHLYIADLVWKWSPAGNTRQQQLVLSGEFLYATDPIENARSGDYHRGWYGSAVYRFHPQWQVGARYGQADLKDAHGDHFHGDQRIRETDLMLSWQHSHFSTLRLQYTHQDTVGFSHDDNVVTLQYVMSLGAHGAHAY